MSVIRTDKWLLNTYDEPVQLCRKLKAQFDEDVHASDIHDFLIMHGMYRSPSDKGEEHIKALQNRDIWQIVQNEKRELKKLWDGPDVPVFIFPSDPDNLRLKQEQNGKSGVAFHDKLFLFVSEANTEDEIRALFTHEYNHVCRLNKYNKNEEDYVLLDTIILEGLAENAVRERLGDIHTANWTAYYPNAKLGKIWRSLILPNRNVPKSSRFHADILYGLRLYPKMAGYCVGYYLVKHVVDDQNLTSHDLLHMDTEAITQPNQNHINRKNRRKK